jgi:hypothetical protein
MWLLCGTLMLLRNWIFLVLLSGFFKDWIIVSYRSGFFNGFGCLFLQVWFFQWIWKVFPDIGFAAFLVLDFGIWIFGLSGFWILTPVFQGHWILFCVSESDVKIISVCSGKGKFRLPGIFLRRMD